MGHGVSLGGTSSEPLGNGTQNRSNAGLGGPSRGHRVQPPVLSQGQGNLDQPWRGLSDPVSQPPGEAYSRAELPREFESFSRCTVIPCFVAGRLIPPSPPFPREVRLFHLGEFRPVLQLVKVVLNPNPTLQSAGSPSPPASWASYADLISVHSVIHVTKENIDRSQDWPRRDPTGSALPV